MTAKLEQGSLFGGDFRVVRPLGQGGMGSVYVVEQVSTGRTRALKIMSPDLVSDAKSRERFLQEAKIGANVQSDHVVEVVAAGVDEASGTPWLAMELLQGETLADRIERTGALAPPEILEVMRQLCHGLGAAHDAGLVHRDIKPENIFLGDSRRQGAAFTVKVLDFGVAKMVREASARGNTTQAVGSPLFMAPEQTGSGHVSPATDVWALGLLAFQLITARSYWRNANQETGTLNGLLVEIVIDALEPASARAQSFGATLPAGFDEWFARCVNREPSARFADANAALAAIEPVLARASSAPVTTDPFVATMESSAIATATGSGLGSRAPRRLWTWAAIAGAGGIALAGVALAVWTRPATNDGAGNQGVELATAPTETPRDETDPSTATEAPAAIEAPTPTAEPAPQVEPEPRAEAPPRPPTPSRPTASDPALPPEAAALLGRAEAALASGDTGEALRLARQSLRIQPSAQAYLVMGQVHCRRHDLGLANGAAAQLPRAARRRLARYCEELGVRVAGQ